MIEILDLRYNLIEAIKFADFVSLENIFSSLRVLLLAGNLIKEVFSVDLLFIAMPRLTSITIPNLSTHLLHIIDKISQSATYLDQYVVLGNFSYFDFNQILLRTVQFNYELILGYVFSQHSKHLFLKKFLGQSREDRMRLQLIYGYGIFCEQSEPDGSPIHEYDRLTF